MAEAQAHIPQLAEEFCTKMRECRFKAVGLPQAMQEDDRNGVSLAHTLYLLDNVHYTEKNENESKMTYSVIDSHCPF